ncbi:MAG: acyltransferase [Herpetosiphon sp.]
MHLPPGRQTARPARRITWLDGLRGVAALLVVIYHVLLIPHVFNWAQHVPWFDLGNCGVVIFFLVSGYIIPTSLQDHGSLTNFWLRRICRLYPLYWLILLTALVLLGLHLIDPVEIGGPAAWRNSTIPPRVVMANVSMAQHWLRSPNVLGLTWTLNIELLFYAFVSLLYLMRLERYPAITTLVVAAGSLAVAAAGYRSTHHSALPYLPVLTFGTLVAQLHRRKASIRTTLAVGLMLLLFLSLPLRWPGLYGDPKQFERGMWLARIVACGIFGVVAYLQPAVPRPLRWLGQISYSLYLWHLIILAVVIQVVQSPAATVILYIVLSLLLAHVTYRTVERGGILFGHKLTTPRPKQPVIVSNPSL